MAVLRLGMVVLASIAAWGCASKEPSGAPSNNASQARAANAAAALDYNNSAPSLPASPIKRTRDWRGAVEQGRLNVTGHVDLQMAGFRPQLTERRSSADDTIAFDLALSPSPNAPVTDLARYQRAGVSPYRHGEVYCGGTRIARFDMIIVQ
jgi:hypothetical protein